MMKMRLATVLLFTVCVYLTCAETKHVPAAEANNATEDDTSSNKLAEQVIVHRDEWGVAHLFGETDESTLFGAGYAQAEDYFWQLEDTTIQALGRYAEIRGKEGLKTDLLARSFELAKRSKKDFARLPPESQKLLQAFAAGVNHLLAVEPTVKPRLLQRFEAWHVLAIDRYLMLTMTYGGSGVRKPRPQDARLSVRDQTIPSYSWDWLDPPNQFESNVREAIGSNSWAIAPQKTKSGEAMLFINPHQPWYGIGQFYEMHLHSKETLRFSGACFFGNPIPVLGHNEYLGWAYTVNQPDVADSWKIEFSHPTDPLKYRFGDVYREAEEWQESISILEKNVVETKTVTFRKTESGPVMSYNGKQAVVAKVARLFDVGRLDQAVEMVRATNFKEWKKAFSRCAIPMFNVTYADRDGNIFYAYNGAVPIRDERFDWSRTVDGSNPATQWKGIHPFDDLPQVLNPESGYVQNCNCSPYLTTDSGNPQRDDFPKYMVRDWDIDKRRSKLARELLSNANEVDFDWYQQLCFDTTLYWPKIEKANWQRQFKLLKQAEPQLASKLEPYLDALVNWDGKADKNSKVALLCISWYEELYGTSQSERIKSEYQGNPKKQLMALGRVAKRLEQLHGDWRLPWGEAHRLQRTAYSADTMEAGVSLLPFAASQPCAGAPGPMGVVFTIYSTPSVQLLRPQRFAVVGCSYMSAIAFGKDKVRAVSLVPFGTSGSPRSPHFRDQADLLSNQKFKQAWFYEKDVLKAARQSYHPGEETPTTGDKK
jgi:penicillin amidase